MQTLNVVGKYRGVAIALMCKVWFKVMQNLIVVVYSNSEEEKGTASQMCRLWSWINSEEEKGAASLMWFLDHAESLVVNQQEEEEGRSTDAQVYIKAC